MEYQLSSCYISASGTGKYDAAEAAAIYFTFKYLGHEKVSILDGGFKEWKNGIEI